MATIKLADMVVVDGNSTWYSQPFELAPDNSTRLDVDTISSSAAGPPYLGLEFSFEVSEDAQKWRPTGNLEGGVVQAVPYNDGWPATVGSAEYSKHARLVVHACSVRKQDVV